MAIFLTPGLVGPPGPQGPAGSTGSRLLDEMTAIVLNGSGNIGTPGTIPYGVGAVLPESGSFIGIGYSSYNPIHVPSGSFM
jgi:hypothetical protein